MKRSHHGTTADTSEDAGILAGHARFLIATAARAPSVHNTQPWRFLVAGTAIELYADPRRKLRADPAGREMLISCGAALYGLRLAVRSLGYLPVVELLPDPGRLRLLARVRAGAPAPASDREQALLKAVPHRHTHRGTFAPGPLPAGLTARLQHDALAEGATLALIPPGLPFQRLADITAAAARRLDLDPRARADARQWTRAVAQTARDGIPAHAFGRHGGNAPGQLRQRDFDLGRGLGQLTRDGPPPPATAVLLTRDDSRADWLRAGQALHRLLLDATTSWVFASLYTQPLEAVATRALIRERLALPGHPQMLLQFGPATNACTTARRPPSDLTGP
jgi:nitroreductase